MYYKYLYVYDIYTYLKRISTHPSLTDSGVGLVTDLIEPLLRWRE